MKNYIVFLVVAAFYARVCQTQDIGGSEVAGSKYMQGILRYCTMVHNTNTDQIIKTYKSEIDDQQAKCAVMCVLQSTRLMDQNGGFQEEEMYRLVNKIPDADKRTKIETTLKECLDQSISPDQTNCDKAFEFTQCLTKMKDIVPREFMPAL